MKKFIAVLLSLLTLVLLVSCDVTFTPSTSGSGSGGIVGGDDPIVDVSAEGVTSQITSLLELEYAKTKITVTTESDGITLKNEFELTKNEAGNTIVSYVIRTANKITFDDDNQPIIPSSQYKETVGKVEIDEDGNATLIDGESANIDFSNISNVKLNFATDNFTDLLVSDVKLTASVKSPSKLLNADGINASDCTISAYYVWGEAVKNVKINYVLSNGSTVKIVYVFTK